MTCITCPDCGKNVNVGFDDCPFCGAKIEASLKESAQRDAPVPTGENSAQLLDMKTESATTDTQYSEEESDDLCESSDHLAGNFRPGTLVPKTGTYKCCYCGPDGMGAVAMKIAMQTMQSMGVPYNAPPSSLQKPPQRFLEKGKPFPSCPDCMNDPSGSDPTGWDFVSEKESKPVGKPMGVTPGMAYFECTRPSGDGKCSDNSCPCGFPGADIPRGSGYFFISEELVEMRRDARSISEIQVKIQTMQQQMGMTMMFGGSGVFMPILMCEMGARKRGIDMAVAAADARHYWETGLAPLRATPMASGTHKAGNETGCFIASACCDSTHAWEVTALSRYRDSFLLPFSAGRLVISIYYKLSPVPARWLQRHARIRTIIRRAVITPIASFCQRRLKSATGDKIQTL